MKKSSSQTLIAALIVMTLGFMLGVGFLTYSRTTYKITQAQIDSDRVAKLTITQ